MGLSAVTFLGDNTRPILEALCAHLTETSGVLIDVHPGPPGSSSDATRSADDADLIWACGLLMVKMIDAGELNGEIVATPVFAGEDRPVYHSVLVARTAPGTIDLAGFHGTVAVNEGESWSGHHALVHHFDAIGLPRPVARMWISGSHRRSVEAVAAGDADLAAIDHTVWAHLVQTTSLTTGLTVIDRTRDWPAPPFTIHRRVDMGTRRRLIDALTAITPGDVEGLAGIVAAVGSDYDVMRPTR